MAPLYCHTLNLNQSFSRAIFQGSMSLSGIGGPLAGQQIMRIRLNNFLNNISQKDISWKVRTNYHPHTVGIRITLINYLTAVLLLWPPYYQNLICTNMARDPTSRPYLTLSSRGSLCTLTSQTTWHSHHGISYSPPINSIITTRGPCSLSLTHYTIAYFSETS